MQHMWEVTSGMTLITQTTTMDHEQLFWQQLYMLSDAESPKNSSFDPMLPEPLGSKENIRVTTDKA